jgi:hypothetical protein
LHVFGDFGNRLWRGGCRHGAELLAGPAKTVQLWVVGCHAGA